MNAERISESFDEKIQGVWLWLNEESENKLQSSALSIRSKVSRRRASMMEDTQISPIYDISDPSVVTQRLFMPVSVNLINHDLN
jgi:hypothetical protein